MVKKSVGGFLVGKIFGGYVKPSAQRKSIRKKKKESNGALTKEQKALVKRKRQGVKVTRLLRKGKTLKAAKIIGKHRKKGGSVMVTALGVTLK